VDTVGPGGERAIQAIVHDQRDREIPQSIFDREHDIMKIPRVGHLVPILDDIGPAPSRFPGSEGSGGGVKIRSIQNDV
jgi:hypothetical protein